APARPDGGPGFALACADAGSVGLDGLRERELANFLFARALVGRQLCAPQVVPRPGHPSAGLGPVQPFLAR
ncbi:MAG: hypothetical protein ACK520_13910, partial [Inhella sp.]